MKHIIKGVLSMAALMSSAMYASQVVTPYYSIRSQGVDAARELAGWSQHVNLDKECFWGTFSITPEYTRSFKSSKIARSLFGSTVSCNNDCDDAVINVSGSAVTSRGANDWLADYFYLPTDFQSTLNFSPRIQNAIVDLNFYLGLDNWAHGLFFRLDLPINWTKWELNMCERITSTGSNDYAPGYFNGYDVPRTIGVERSKLLNSFGQYACGGAPTGVTVDGTSPAVTFDPLCYAKICCDGHSTTRLADLQMILGWNFLECENYHLGVGIIARAPTGNRPTGEYLFEPISGNGGHWELGAHITSHVNLWRCEESDRSLGFYLDANITHLFNAKQTRTFDLKCKPLSRYMLAEKFTSPAVGLSGTTAVPSAQFANEFTPVANLTTREVKVSVGVQGDLAAQFTYVKGNWNFDLGYNFWGRSCEKVHCNNDCVSTCTTSCLSSCNNSCNISCNTSCNNSCPSTNSCNACANVTFAPNTWGLKGDAYVYGFRPAGDFTAPVALSATEHCATINGGTNGTSTINAGIDNPQLASTALIDGSAIFNTPTRTAQTNTSVDPVFINCIDFNQVGTSGLSNKFYAHLSYNWTECDKWQPYLGIGAYGEWGSNSSNCKTSCCSTSCPATPSVASNTCASSCNSCDNDCLRASLSQWGVWAKFGVSYN